MGIGPYKSAEAAQRRVNAIIRGHGMFPGIIDCKDGTWRLTNDPEGAGRHDVNAGVAEDEDDEELAS